MSPLSAQISHVKRHVLFERIDSTNSYARNLNEPADTGLIVVQAKRQSAGRGQKGHAFFSDIPGGLWASIIIQLDDIADHFRCNRSLIMSIFDSVQACCRKAPLRIKWPNDLYWGDRKICGILLEASARLKKTIVAGFGVNVNFALHDFPPHLQDIATSMQHETGQCFDIDVLLRDILVHFHSTLHSDQQKIHQRYRSRQMGFGHEVILNTHRGIYRDVADDGHLMLDVNGAMQRISSGPMQFLD
ncbi:MAG: biotin--[acetyl-CoA-carboxylase] ligase [Chitinivibrionales bacterium]|nr:biotin--[acetyl-CoA-carboxylase] ligase [Chitinivibrionales bacterium]